VCGNIEENASFVETLRNELETEIHTFDTLKNAIISREKQSTLKAEMFADAYGAAVIDSSDIDLFPKKKEEEITVKKKNPFPAVILTIVLCAVVAALIVFPTLTLRNLKSQEEQLTQQLSQLTITEIDVQQITAELMLLLETADSTERFAALAERFSALMIMTQADSALPSNTGIEELLIDDREITISGRSGTSRGASDYARELRRTELFENVQFTMLESRGDYTYFGLRLTRIRDEAEGGNTDEND
jgi:Tfp pilus assembly protein PilN